MNINMNSLSLMVSVAMVAAVTMAETPETGAKKPLKVLMIGNSFSESVMCETPKLAAASGFVLDIAQAGIGGCPLDKHWTNVVKSTDAEFKPYGLHYSYGSLKDQSKAPIAKLGRKTNIPQALVAEKWDVVTIQQASGKSAFYDTYLPYADNLIAKIRELALQAEIVIQETWSYSPYDGRLAAWKLDPKGMHAALKDAYSQLAKKHGLRVIPTGDAAQLFRERLPVNYGTPLTKKEIAALKQPETIDFHGDVAGSSAWKKGRKGKQKDWQEIKLRTDFTHFNARGHYLQACVWTAFLFKADPTAFTYRPDGLPESEAKLMRECARDAIKAWCATGEGTKYETQSTTLSDPFLGTQGEPLKVGFPCLQAPGETTMGISWRVSGLNRMGTGHLCGTKLDIRGAVALC